LFDPQFYFAKVIKIHYFDKNDKIMSQIDLIRNGLIDKLLSITDKDYLLALLRLVNSSDVQDEKIKLTKEQKLMLEMSLEDMRKGRIVSQSELDKSDLEWLKGK